MITKIYKTKIKIMTPEYFFTKNMKYFALALLLLFFLKTIQSCNRGMQLKIGAKEYVHTIDSLETRYNIYYKESEDSIKKLNFELKLSEQSVQSANDRASAVQSAVEKIKSNTTVVVKGVEEVKNK